MRSSFTAGILDVFLAFDYRPFKRIIGVSSGAMAMSYYTANQPKSFIEIARALVDDPGFIDFKSAFSAPLSFHFHFKRAFARSSPETCTVRAIVYQSQVAQNSSAESKTILELVKSPYKTIHSTFRIQRHRMDSDSPAKCLENTIFAPWRSFGRWSFLGQTV